MSTRRDDGPDDDRGLRQAHRAAAKPAEAAPASGHGHAGDAAGSLPGRRLFKVGIEPAPSSNTHLDPQAQRAFALLYALNAAGNTAALNTLVEFAGEEPRYRQGSVTIPPGACTGLARALRRAGYPLDDDGIRRFKSERGFSPRVRIGAEVAVAYARFSRGNEARLNLSESDWQSLGDEARRALRLLLATARRPEDIAAVRDALGVQQSPETPSGTTLIGRATAERLVTWLHNHGMALTDHGLRQLQMALGLVSPDLSVLEPHLIEALLGRIEPRHDYVRIEYQGHPVNGRTAKMLNNAAAALKPETLFRVARGSYLTEGLRGAHPHMGGGVVDLAVPAQETAATGRAVVALREAGFAAWLRSRPGQPPHIHAVAIGDREMAPAAKWQVGEFLAGRSGRTRAERDPHAELPARLPAWTLRYRFRDHGDGLSKSTS